jgi:hypothetical protein
LYKLNNLFIYFWKNWIYTYRVEKEKIRCSYTKQEYRTNTLNNNYKQTLSFFLLVLDRNNPKPKQTLTLAIPILLNHGWYYVGQLCRWHVGDA